MTISENGINLIKKYEGCRLTAYKPVASEKYWTIGWGHYGEDVKKGMTITQDRANELLRADLMTFEAYVRKQCNYLNLNQNQFDALVSFTYNCGQGNLIRLTANKTRSIKEISAHIEAYNKGANGLVLAGLVRRRKEEKELFLKEVEKMADMPELSLVDKINKIKQVMNIDDNTIQYNKFYKYGVEYIDKQYKVCVDAEKWREHIKNG